MSYLHDDKIKFLEQKANDIRESIIEMLVQAGSGHTAGPLGMADIFTAFYFHILNHDPRNPLWEERDRLVLSNGHICPVQYAALAHAGYFPIEELKTLRKFGTRLQGHPHRGALPGIEITSGPLGSGFGQAVGIAYGARMDGSTSSPQVKFRTYVFMGDGEQDCGIIWEAAMFAGKNKLSNLTGIIDRNNIQIDGMTEDIMPLEPLRMKYESFGWHVLDIDGHNFEEIVNAVEEAKAIYEKPTMIIAHTIPGKGIKEIEFDYKWHGIPPNKEQAAKFLHELRTLGGKITSEHQ
ncbi:transketolase [Candidatus Giovannonibacteria bacterium RIFCSPHIGHO2_02_FULL_44_31]|uniref:Transketolase n=1 Tax=Candidatus Giovannonibacteria bacterium RIFCSPLOWO2_12_FULL_44_15 TaxID=1798364 RepID=A0A1F5XZY3_9BACT|nr:MAG: transketolase [Candidatus Giovannonibacteria bacterium RIFCSPHIGHO2_02_FULL_44_31]OGF77121.1 MAG: transketolase [Candidatus Giovannonibacteria bacterium RIFCSPHIGHO2_12_FULL_44_29]OGF93350.1 MAG: transketolase [Candidatus Giovannonibacteria bacterium RIFCSPLOWO2_12_FULL_44_15]